MFDLLEYEYAFGFQSSRFGSRCVLLSGGLFQQEEKVKVKRFLYVFAAVWI